MENHFIICITKVNIVHYKVALELTVLCCAVLAVSMFPCPHTCSLFRWLNLAVNNFCIYKIYISVILFRLFVKKFENSVCTCKSHNNAVELHTNLINWLTEIFVKCHKCHKSAKCKSCKVIKRKHTADYCAKHIADITELCIDRHKNICKFICIICAVKKFVVEFVKFFNSLTLVIKYLYNFLTVHHFFNVAVYLAEVILLSRKIFTALAADFARYNKHYRNHNKCKKCKRNTD